MLIISRSMQAHVLHRPSFSLPHNAYTSGHVTCHTTWTWIASDYDATVSNYMKTTFTNTDSYKKQHLLSENALQICR